MSEKKISWVLFFLGIGLFLSFYLPSFPYSPVGIHAHRQADTLFAGYSYCFEKTPFFLPKIAHRQMTSGVAIGELPLLSYIFSLPCQWTGVWSESWPKVFMLLLFALNAWIWGLWIRCRFRQVDWATWLGLFIFSNLVLSHFAIPIPDSLAFFFLGLAGYFWEKSFRKGTQSFSWEGILSIFLFSIGFWIRPYLIPVLFLIGRSWKQIFATIILCCVIYIFWFRHWVLQSELPYYATNLQSFSTMIHDFLPSSYQSILQLVKRHINYLGLLPLILFFRSQKKFSFFEASFWNWEESFIFSFLLWLGSFLLVLIGKGLHILNHNYYLFAACWLSLIFIYLQIQSWSVQRKNLFLGVYILVGIAGTFHQWRVQKPFLGDLIAQQIQIQKIPSDAKIAVYISDNPQFLYWAHRTGWVLFEKDFQGPESCPSGADYFLMRSKEDQILIQPCLNPERK